MYRALDLRSEGLGFDSQAWLCAEMWVKLHISHCLGPLSRNGYLVHKSKVGSIVAGCIGAHLARIKLKSVEHVHSLVTSHVDYCNALLLGVPDYKIKRLQRMHNIAARIVERRPHDHDIDAVLQSLHWLPVKSRILFKTLLLVYKCENGLAPEYLSSLLVPYVQ